MKSFTYADIESWQPCYSPDRYLPKNWRGTALDILDDKRIPLEDRLWVILRTELVSEKLMRIFAVWCARQVQHLIKDQRSLDALDVMEAYSEFYFEIDDKDWREAWELERAAAWDAAWAAARAAAGDAARDAAGDAARAAAGDAARGAAWAAARGAAWAAARAAAGDAAWDAQKVKLREMLIAGVETGDTK